MENRAAHKGKIGPKIGPKIGTPQNGNMFNDFYKSFIEMGREYSHWIDLRLIKPMEVVI